MRAGAVCSLILLVESVGTGTACPSASDVSGRHARRQPGRPPTASLQLAFASCPRPHHGAEGCLATVCRKEGKMGLRFLEAAPGASLFPLASKASDLLSEGGAPEAAGGGSEDAQSQGADAQKSQQRYPVPVLGAFAVADAEVNVAIPPPSRRTARRAGDPRAQDERNRGKQKGKPGFKPIAGLGAMLGFLAAGPAGAIAGATASVVTSKKDSLAGDTVRTAAKAAETLGSAAWDVTSKAASAVQVEDFVRKGVDVVDDSMDGFRKRGPP